MASSALHDRLANGGNVVIGEGYLFEFQRRGYLQAGTFVPEVVLNHPHLVKSLTEEFIHAGSDVALAFTYYGHREKMRLIGKEDKLAALNKKALEIAGNVAKATGALFAGDLSNTTVYQRGNAESFERTELMFKEQIEWAVDAKVDYIVAETFNELGEATMALECIQKYAPGIPAVVTLCGIPRGITGDGVPLEGACRKLEEAGASVVGLNCWMGPGSILPLMTKIRQACQGPIACLPVAFQTNKEYPSMQSIINPVSGCQAFPDDIFAHQCGRTEVRKFAVACKEMGVQYVGLCCGSQSDLLREVAEVYGRCPPASKYKTDMSKHFVFGNVAKDPHYFHKIKEQFFK